MPKEVLVICGTGVATSTVVATKIKEFCTEQGIDISVRQGKVMDLLNQQTSPDLIVATTEVPATSVPIISGLPFLTGVGIDSTLEEIARSLNR